MRLVDAHVLQDGAAGALGHTGAGSLLTLAGAGRADYSAHFKRLGIFFVLPGALLAVIDVLMQHLSVLAELPDGSFYGRIAMPCPAWSRKKVAPVACLHGSILASTRHTGSSSPLLSMLRESAVCRCPQRDIGPHAFALLFALLQPRLALKLVDCAHHAGSKEGLVLIGLSFLNRLCPADCRAAQWLLGRVVGLGITS